MPLTDDAMHCLWLQATFPGSHPWPWLANLATWGKSQLQIADGINEAPWKLRCFLKVVSRLLSHHPGAHQYINNDGLYQACIDFLKRSWLQQPRSTYGQPTLQFTACQQLAAVQVLLVAKQDYQQLAQPHLDAVLLATAMLPSEHRGW